MLTIQPLSCGSTTHT